ncbi:hypothetical protein V6380_05920 [Acinetobacter variabilis]|uniref:hypothetical protein n=1 Tax=Acinetobacter TaxID=469 RepID=UPI001269CB99|nr:hypothetical protein [Acinetobacter sp. YZS-X1-1]
MLVSHDFSPHVVCLLRSDLLIAQCNQGCNCKKLKNGKKSLNYRYFSHESRDLIKEKTEQKTRNSGLLIKNNRINDAVFLGMV